MLKKIALIISLIFVFGLFYLVYAFNLLEYSSLGKDSPLNSPLSYYSSSRIINTAIIGQKYLLDYESQVQAINHSAASLAEAIPADSNYEKIIFLSTPEQLSQTQNPLEKLLSEKFPSSQYEIIYILPDKDEKYYYDLIRDRINSSPNFLIIINNTYEYSDHDNVLIQLEEKHFENTYNNLDKAGLMTLPYSNPEAMKAVYQISKEQGSLKALPTLQDKTDKYHIKFLAQGYPQTTNKASLTFFGDIMLGRYVRTLMDRNSLDYPFQNMSSNYLQMNDLMIANLEGPIAKQSIFTSKEIAFRFLPDVAPLLKKYHFDALSIANNHALDMGLQGLIDTYEIGQMEGLTIFGNPKDLSDPHVAEMKINGVKIALIGLNDTDFKIKKEEVSAIIRKEVEKGYKTIPFIHWGTEYVHTPGNRQVDLAHSFIDDGAIMVVGMHPHVVQSMEIYQDAPIFYSLGNAVFDQYFSQDTQEGLSLNLQIEGDSIKVYLFPIKIEHSQMRLMNEAERIAFLEKFTTWWRYDEEIKNQILKGEIVINHSK